MRGKLKALIKKIEYVNLDRNDPKARQCGHKDRYPDFEKAKRAARKFEKSGGGRMNAYLCRYCKLFHIGHATVVQ